MEGELEATLPPLKAPTEPPPTETAAAQPVQPAAPMEITRALSSEPPSLDPHGSAGSGQNVILPFLFDTLVYSDFNDRYLPYLATDWNATEDGKTVTFHLRKDVTFHDGTPFNAQAVIFNIDRLRKAGPRSPASNGVAEIKSVEAVDDYTVQFHFDQPSSILLSTLATPYAAIVSPTAAQKEGDAFGQQPVGSGPYMLESWNAGSEITLVANPAYHWPPSVVQNQGKPYVDRLVFKVIPDPTTQVSAYEAGEIDMLFITNPGHLAKFRKDPGASVAENTLNSLIYMGFNLKRSPLDLTEVRQALSHAINKQEIVNLALGGIGEPAFAPLPPTLPGFDESLKQSEQAYDPGMTQQLLKQAGFTQASDGGWTKGGKPLKLSLLTSTRPPNEAIATVLQSQLQAVGVPLEIQQLDSTAAMASAAKGDYDIMLWRYDWNDADVLNVYLASDRIGSTNRQFYSSSAVDALLGQGAHELDETARKNAYVEAQKIILQDSPWQPLYNPKDFTVIRKSISGVVVGPMGRILLNDAKVTE